MNKDDWTRFGELMAAAGWHWQGETLVNGVITCSVWLHENTDVVLELKGDDWRQWLEAGQTPAPW